MVSDSVRRVADRLGLELGDRLAGGEFGAFRARAADGRWVVLKVLVRSPGLSLDRVTRAVEFTEALRAQGYPAPRYLDVGGFAANGGDGEDVYTMQEYVDAHVPALLSRPLVDQLLDLTTAQADVAAALGHPDPDLGNSIVSTIATDGQRLLSVTSDPRVTELVHRALVIAGDADPGIVRTGDIAHQDFHTENVLARDDRVVAVVDWEGAQAGDARLDLIRLMATSIVGGQVDSGSAAYLRAEVTRRVPTDVHALFGAMLLVRDLVFAIEWRPDALPWVLAVSKNYLPDL